MAATNMELAELLSKAEGRRRVIQGHDEVARLPRAAVTEYRPADLTIGYAEVNGGPAALLFAGGELSGSWSWTPPSKATGCARSRRRQPRQADRAAGAVREHP